MKRRDFFKAAGAGVAVAPLAIASTTAAQVFPDADPLKALISWIEERFTCEQGILGAWADEEGQHAYFTLRWGALPEKFSGGESAAKLALVDRMRNVLAASWNRARIQAKRERPILKWRSPIQFNDDTVYERKLGKLLCTAEQAEDESAALHVPDDAVHDEETGNYYDKIEMVTIRMLRIRTRLFIPDDLEFVGVREGVPVLMIEAA